MSDEDAPRLVIGSLDSDFLSLEAAGPTDRDEWVPCSCELRYGAFHARSQGLLMLGELSRFRDALANLYRVLDDEVLLCPLEPWLELRMSGDGRGHIAVTCQLQDDPGIWHARLIAKFEIDQTQLFVIVQQLERVIVAASDSTVRRS